MIEYNMRQINEALNALSCEVRDPDWESVQVLTVAINELERWREGQLAEAKDKTIARLAQREADTCTLLRDEVVRRQKVEAENGELRGVLEAAQFGCNFGDWPGFCPACHRQKKVGHLDWCQIGKALSLPLAKAHQERDRLVADVLEAVRQYVYTDEPSRTHEEAIYDTYKRVEVFDDRA